MNRIHADFAPDLLQPSTFLGPYTNGEPGLFQDVTTSKIEIAGYLFRLAVTALSEGYPATAATHLRESASILATAAQHEQDSRRCAALLGAVRLVEAAAADSARYVHRQARLDLIFAHVQLTLAHNQLQRAVLSLSNGAHQRTGCYLDSTIRQLARAQAWLNHTVPWLDSEHSADTDAQRIADALAEGWAVRNDRVNELITRLDCEISALAGSLHVAIDA